MTSLTAEDKRRKLQARRRCFRCAKRNHVAGECARNLQCAPCAARRCATPSQEPSKRLGNTSAPYMQRASTPESIDTPLHATYVPASGTGVMPVFLQTGRAWAAAPARSILLRFLLHTGSQRPFVRRDVSRALICPVQGVERLNLFTFGKTQRHVTLTCNRVSVTLRCLRSQHSTNETTIDALEVSEVSVVTSPPVDGAIISIMTHHGLVPTDARSEAKIFREDEISILIGSNFYWDVVIG
ncbi:hypothetical protein HPB49_017781 [Dermacentor silvarum]|uniref:Uncharacterized protein n=1 Tax=Dermacentor silvarum TaxID=543639 RepID=A0ACB8DFB3_DERSI|nr:hypothetical protein HPB49_017781 [Dermacentor silvarum]